MKDDKERAQQNDPEQCQGSKNPKSSGPGYPSKREIDELEAHLVRHEKTESKKPKTSNKLPRRLDESGPSCEQDNVGDDVNKKSEQDILCECHPNVTGAAIPQMISFNSLPSTSKGISDDSIESDEEDDHPNRVIKSHASTNLIPSIAVGPCFSLESLSGSSESTVKEEKEMSHDPAEAQKKTEDIKSKLPSNSPSVAPTKKPQKRPSLIPKFSRPSSSTKPVRDCGKLDLLVNSDKANQLNSKKADDNPISKKASNEISKNSSSGTSKISSRMLDLQERLKATTSMLRRKFEDDKKKSGKSVKKQSGEALSEQGSSTSASSSEKSVTSMLDDLLRNISQMKATAVKVQTSCTQKIQREYIEKLFLNISEIQKIADKLSELDKNSTTPENTRSEEPKIPKETVEKKPKKENKICIKFMQLKDKGKESKKKVGDLQIDNTEGVQTDLALGSKLTSESLNSDTEVKKPQHETPLKESDSMDGVFIPSCEPPMNTEEEDETNGLDITITFPEVTNTLSKSPESHLSVRLSDISAEALRQLKRCPKDFTLRMDFVQGKVLFQTGKAPVNNFSIGPDLKFVENVVDSKKSDIISIKPSTECSFASQLISVENVNKELGSGRSLRATDSEIFSVVNMPFIYRNPSSVTKSCVTFKNDGIFSMAILAGQFVRSMPQIPCLTNIFDDGFIENVNRAADSREKAEKSTKPEKGNGTKY